MRKGLTALMLLAVSTTLLWSQERPRTAQDVPAEAPKPRIARTRVIRVHEVALTPGAPLKPEPGFKAVPYPGAPKEGSFHLVVVVSRQILTGTRVTPTDLDAKLTYPRLNRPTLPVAVAVKADELDDDGSYKVADKDRRVAERYHFAVVRGQRDWTFECKGCTPTGLLKFYVTLFVENHIRGKGVTVRLPDGSEVVVGASRTNEMVFPVTAGDLEFLLEGGIRAGEPFKRLKPGQSLIVSFSDSRRAPAFDHDTVVGGLNLIRIGYEKYKSWQGKGYVGGGSYDVGPEGQPPVKVTIYFNEKGIISSIASSKARLKATLDDKGKVTQYQGTGLKIEPTGKQKTVTFSPKADRIIGLTTIGIYKIDGPRSKPSLWDKGVLKRGLLKHAKRGDYEVKAKEFSEGFYILYGEAAR